jgi:hypothetical protein
MEHLIELILDLNNHPEFGVKGYKEPCGLAIDGEVYQSNMLGDRSFVHGDGTFSYFLDPAHPTIGEALTFFNILIQSKIDKLKHLSNKISTAIGDLDREIVSERADKVGQLPKCSYRLLEPKVDTILETDEFLNSCMEWESCKGDPNCGHWYTQFMLPIRRKI